MYNVIQLFIRFGPHFLFVAMQVFCFYLIINYNQTQKEIFLNSSQLVAGKIYETKSYWNGFLNLRESNDSLRRENANLIENLIIIDYSLEKIQELDTTHLKYSLIPAEIINKTFDKRNNYFTLNKGSRLGVKTGMGVISPNKGLVGIVRNVSTNFSQVISILHSQTKISCSIKNRDGFGTLIWKTMDPHKMSLIGIPKHEAVSKGDTIITSGYSTMFPKGILVGKVEDFSVIPGKNSFDITVKLFNDLTKINYAYIIQNRFSDEQINLEKEVDYE